MSCLFCNYPKEKYIAEDAFAFAFAIFDNFSVNEGHALIIPKSILKVYLKLQRKR